MINDVLVLKYSGQSGAQPPENIIKLVQELQNLGFQIQISNQGDGTLRYVLQRNTEKTG
ncbi:hypothetical protein HPT25_17090 [Bacillus sp. BRMEA1]|uniref:hypothetical protein n=1 Tax=Neobacillus endophyticus TaxID=2738405 RepID=UPI0015631E67|nr:hypothetical protein [Neobacillus endophyticus]NRD79076.1 hypothetical protein [Neobacillus endophyticus]